MAALLSQPTLGPDTGWGPDFPRDAGGFTADGQAQTPQLCALLRLPAPPQAARDGKLELPPLPRLLSLGPALADRRSHLTSSRKHARLLTCSPPSSLGIHSVASEKTPPFLSPFTSRQPLCHPATTPLLISRTVSHLHHTRICRRAVPGGPTAGGRRAEHSNPFHLYSSFSFLNTLYRQFNF